MGTSKFVSVSWVRSSPPAENNPGQELFKNRMNSLQDLKIGSNQRLYSSHCTWHLHLRTTSKPNRRLTSGSVRFWPVSIVLNNDRTAGQPAVEFEAALTCNWVWKCPIIFWWFDMVKNMFSQYFSIISKLFYNSKIKLAVLTTSTNATTEIYLSGIPHFETHCHVFVVSNWFSLARNLPKSLVGLLSTWTCTS